MLEIKTNRRENLFNAKYVFGYRECILRGKFEHAFSKQRDSRSTLGKQPIADRVRPCHIPKLASTSKRSRAFGFESQQ